MLDDLGRSRIWREIDAEVADLETVIGDLVDGQYRSPSRVIAFNTSEGWSQDVSADVANEVRRPCDLLQRDLPFFLQPFTDRHQGRYRDYQLSLLIRLV